MKQLPLAPPHEDGDAKTTPGEARLTAILRGVVVQLGRPPDFLRTTVRAVTADDFRVNVLAGADAATVRIAHSYYVTAAAAGTLTASAPAIRHCY